MQHFLYDKATKLVNAFPERWISTCKVLEQVLFSWDELERRHLDNGSDGVFPLAVHKTAIKELFSLMKPISVLIKDSQQSGGPTGLSTFIDLCMLQNDTLNTTKPLTIQVARRTRVGQTSSTSSTSTRAPANLQQVTIDTREKLRNAILKHFFYKRYNEYVAADQESGYVFEMAACLSPSIHDLKWLNPLFSSEAEANRVRAHIKEKVVNLMVTMDEGVGVGMQPEEPPDNEDPAPSSKRKLPDVMPAGFKKQDDALTMRMSTTAAFLVTAPTENQPSYPCAMFATRSLTASTLASRTRHGKLTRWGHCFRSGPERASRSTPTWRMWRMFYCLCRRHLQFSGGTSVWLGASSLGLEAGWGVNTWR